MTLDRLTTFQLDTAAHDLRNAALVVKHAGHFKNAAMDPSTGRVCAAGAIDLATYRRMGYLGHVKVYAFIEDYGDNHRAENAYEVLADFLPEALCDKCDLELKCKKHPGEDCKSAITPWEKVTHYNDTHCIGGDLLINMMNCAADRAVTLAAERRTMLTGRLRDAV